MKGDRALHKTQRRGAAVFSNGHHVLQLVDVTVLAAQESDAFYADEREAERLGLERLAETKPGEHWDYVGILFAATGGLDRGLINWATDFERVEVIV
jgi:hypothetical protein